MLAAYLLHARYDVTLFESAARLGGHTHTVTVADPRGPLNIDTGFIVYNERNYPHFTRLLARLGVATQPSNMSFALRDERSGLEYQGDSINTLFAQRRNLLRPSFYRMLLDVARFYRRAPELLSVAPDALTLGEYVRQARFSDIFVQQHLIPMGAAIWSANPREFLEFPAPYFVRFCHNHGMLNFRDRPSWRTITGGSIEYLRKLTAPLADRIRLSTPVRAIRRAADRVEIVTDGPAERFDQVVLATHSDQALALLADPAPEEREILGAMRYQPNETTLHTDTSVLPRTRRAWASWNYHVPASPSERATITYNMNMLQTLASDQTYCVTLNRAPAIDPARVLLRLEYHHPVYTCASVAAQQRHAEISGRRRTHFCGAYWGYGFHEDGVNSALRVATGLGINVDALLCAPAGAAGAGGHA